MSKIVFLVGLPASGKSTYAAHFSKEFVVISTDSIRAELYGSEDVRGDGEKVFGIAHERALNALRKGKDVILDATHLYRTSRAKAKEYKVMGYGVEAVEFDVPYEVCLKRNAERNRHVPEDVMKRMAERMSFPDFDEGFDYISTYVDHTGD